MTMDRRPNVRPHRIECQRTNDRPEKKMKKKIEKKQKQRQSLQREQFNVMTIHRYNKIFI